MEGKGIFFILIGFLYFFSFFFTFLVIAKLLRWRTRIAALSILIVISGLLTVLVFSTSMMYEISLSLLTYYSIIVFLVYVICLLLIREKKSKLEAGADPHEIFPH